MKKFYREHRVFVILMGVVLLCTLIILGVFFKSFFIGGTRGAPKRTCAMIDDARQSEIVDGVKTDKLVKDASMRISNKSNIVFITMSFETSASLVEAQGKAVTLLDKFSDDDKECYDFQFTIDQAAADKSEGFLLMGSKNKAGKFSWNNNRSIEE